jgi:hypothetical protein
MAANTYVIDSSFKLEAEFTNESGVADPTTVIFKIKKPDGTITTYTYGVDAEVIRESLGVYYMIVTVDTPGNWWYKIMGTEALIAATEGSFVGLQSKFD